MAAGEISQCTTPRRLQLLHSATAIKLSCDFLHSWADLCCLVSIFRKQVECDHVQNSVYDDNNPVYGNMEVCQFFSIYSLLLCITYSELYFSYRLIWTMPYIPTFNNVDVSGSAASFCASSRWPRKEMKRKETKDYFL